jgi:transmembrane sensor
MLAMEGAMSTDLNALQREAVAWVQRLISGQGTPDDADALKRWCAQSPAHMQAFAEASRVWRDIKPAAQLLRDGVQILPPRGSARQYGRPARRAVLAGGLAAAAAYLIVRPPLGLWPSLSELRADYRTVTGEQRQLMLGDDVAVVMNTQTSIMLEPPEAETYRVQLIAGEASFTTAPQARRALVVVAAQGMSIGSGARFNVRYLRSPSQAVSVTCFDGEVRIEQRAQSVRLGVGQQVRYDDSGLSGVITVDPDIISAWQRGIVVFRATPLVEVVEEINRYRPGRIVLINPALAEKPVSGRFRIDRLDGILTQLEQASGAGITTLPGGIALLS